jgi:hypothetical protein
MPHEPGDISIGCWQAQFGRRDASKQNLAERLLFL